jgi:kinesin family protein 4/21/27
MNGGAAGTAVMKAAPPQRITPTGEAAAAWESPSTPAHAFPETSEATAVAAATATATTAVANTNPRSSSCVQVAVRVRPVLPWEKKECVCKVHPESSSIQIAGAAGPRFTFDRVFSPSTTQAALFTAAVQPLVDKCLEGYNATIFAYGQTGSGKTHTILGPADSWMSYEGSASSVEEEEEDAAAAGVLPRALHALFQALQAEAAQDPCFTYSVTLQFLEVYGEDLRDLLAPRTSSGASKLTVREYNDEPEVPGALAIPCPTALDATRAVQAGSLRRVTAATAMNATSSRSHALLTVALEQGWGEDRHSGLATTKRSKFHFCDLAGSERQKRTLSTGQRLKEGIEINKGLLVLGNVISSLASNSSHVPYRDSKLTRLLRGSLGGNHQTLMMACVSPAPENMDESLNCLRYANRAKNIQNSAIVNLDAASRRLLELQQQIVALAQSLLVVVPSSSDKPWTVQQHQAALAQISYSRNDLEVLVEGGSASVVGIDKTLSSLTPLKSGSIHNSSTPGAEHSAVATPAAPTPWTSHSADHRSRPSTSLRGLHDTMDRDRPYDWEERISAMEHELHRTQALLRESQENHDVAEMELYQYRARERLNVQPHEKENDVSERFVEQATAYEQEIAILHKELQKAERKANRLMMWQTVDPRDDEKLLGDAKKRLGDAEDNLTQDRLRLQQLQSTPAAESLEASGQLTVKPSTSMATSSSSESLDEEEHAEQAILQKWTKKYLVQGGHVDEDDETGHLVPNEETVHAASTEHKQLHMEADLVELTRSIEERENLIVDLKVSQEKYAVSELWSLTVYDSVGLFLPSHITSRCALSTKKSSTSWRAS